MLRQTFDRELQELLDRVAPKLETPAGPLEFHDLDDFHPDVLFAEAPVFVELRRLRKQLADEEGIPYQTLIASVLHKFVEGQLSERK